MFSRELSLPGLFIFEPKVYQDERGYFFESWRHDVLEKACGAVRFVQENESKSKKGVFRGFHYQLPPKAQAKWVRVVQGKALDVVIDIRKGSKTFGLVEKVELSEENKKSFFIPVGFAHGFLTLSETCIFQYKVTQYFDSELDRSLSIDSVPVDWPLSRDDILLSPKDLKSPKLDPRVAF